MQNQNCYKCGERVTGPFCFEDGYIDVGATEPSTALVMMTWVSNNYGYANLMMAVFCAAWIKLFFFRYKYNYFEILVLLCFVYIAWAIGQFFESKRWRNYAFGFVAYFLGVLSFVIITMLVGHGIDVVMLN